MLANPSVVSVVIAATIAGCSRQRMLSRLRRGLVEGITNDGPARVSVTSLAKHLRTTPEAIHQSIAAMPQKTRRTRPPVILPPMVPPSRRNARGAKAADGAAEFMRIFNAAAEREKKKMEQRERNGT